jgi:hypothetical protein
MDWFLQNRPDLGELSSYYIKPEANGGQGRRLLAIPSRERLLRVLRYMLDEQEFLSPYGIRSVSRVHRDRPYSVRLAGKSTELAYEPGESSTGLFGGNSNWRGPIWFPLNYLIIEALERYYHFYRNELTVEFPTGSGRLLNLKQVADELSCRLCKIFMTGADGKRPWHGEDHRFSEDPSWQNWSCFTNISMAKPAAAWAQVIKLAGPPGDQIARNLAKKEAQATRDPKISAASAP